MKAFYELYRDSQNELLVTYREDFSFPHHFHAAVEVFILLKGKYRITVDDQTYELNEKSVFISDTFCMHSYTKISEGPSESVMLIIPTSYLVEYNELKNGLSLQSYVSTNETLVHEVYTLAGFINAHLKDEQIKQHYTNVLLLLLLNELGTTDCSKKQDVTTIKNVLLYIEEHFKENITLESISKHFGYTSCHLSRIFHSYFTMSISRYINTMRIKYIESKKGTTKNLLYLIYESGFQSPQTYYRNLKSYQEQASGK